MSTSFAITLTPNDWDLRAKSFTLGEREWKLAVALVDETGFRPNIVGGVDKRDVGPFARYLAQALQQTNVPDQDRRSLDDLLWFLTYGAGNRGLGISRGWKKWNHV